MLKFSGITIWRLGSRATLRKFSSSSATVYKTENLESSKTVSGKSVQPLENEDKGSGLVAAVFASINAPEGAEVPRKPSLKSVKLNKSQQIDNQIQSATDVQTLLVVAENSVISRKHALKIVSILSDWSTTNKVKISDFEKDPRFLKLCRILARSSTSQAMMSLNMADDLSTVLGITGDDEAARLITNLSLPQMVKVMKALHQKRRRSTPLLRALSNNIVKQTETIDLKRSADLLFSMVALNFPDPVLLDRICDDVISSLPSNPDKPAVVTSITVSLGLLKYRHETSLDSLVMWSCRVGPDVCRAPDLAATVVTLATLDYVPAAAGELIEAVKNLKEENLNKPSAWLDLVFSLLILNKAEERHLQSVLSHEFIDRLLATGEIPIPSRRKLMAIDGYVSLQPKYKGPRLHEHISVGVPVVYTKEKSFYVQSVMDTLMNMVSSDKFLKRDCNTKMGFLYDGEFALDAKCHPVSLEKAANNKEVFRIAVLSLDYHDMCRKSPHMLGVYRLYTRLLNLMGYRVLKVPYTEFNPRDNLVTKVKYIEKKLKDLVNNKHYTS